MDENLRKYLQEKYSQQLGGLNTAQAFANLGDVIAGQKVGSQNPFYSEQRGLAEQGTLGEINRQEAMDIRRQQAQDALELRKEQMRQAVEIAKGNQDLKRMMLDQKTKAAGLKGSETEGQKAVDKDYAKDYNDWLSSGMGTVDKNIKRLEDAKQELINDPSVTGRFIGRTPEWMQPEKNIRIKQDVQAAAQGALKATLGAQFTEKEGERIMNMAYDPRLSAETNIQKIDAAIKELRTNQSMNNAKADYFEKNGTLTGFGKVRPSNIQNKQQQKTEVGRQYSPSRDQTKITYSDGSEEVVSGKQSK